MQRYFTLRWGAHSERAAKTQWKQGAAAGDGAPALPVVLRGKCRRFKLSMKSPG